MLESKLIFNIILLKIIVNNKQKTGLKIESVLNIFIPLIIKNLEHKSNNPEGRRIFPNLSVLENLKIGAYLRNDDLEEDLNMVYGYFPRLKERSLSVSVESLLSKSQSNDSISSPPDKDELLLLLFLEKTIGSTL